MYLQYLYYFCNTFIIHYYYFLLVSFFIPPCFSSLFLPLPICFGLLNRRTPCSPTECTTFITSLFEHCVVLHVPLVGGCLAGGSGLSFSSGMQGGTYSSLSVLRWTVLSICGFRLARRDVNSVRRATVRAGRMRHLCGMCRPVWTRGEHI